MSLTHQTTNTYTNAAQTHLDLPLVDFRIQLLCRWSDGEFEEFVSKK